jgi:hypothetical protein
MLYNTQNYWVPGLSPSSGILKTRRHVSEMIPFPSLDGVKETPTLLGSSERTTSNTRQHKSMGIADYVSVCVQLCSSSWCALFDKRTGL